MNRGVLVATSRRIQKVLVGYVYNTIFDLISFTHPFDKLLLAINSVILLQGGMLVKEPVHCDIILNCSPNLFNFHFRCIVRCESKQMFDSIRVSVTDSLKTAGNSNDLATS